MNKNMDVYIANFGRENYEWPACLEKSTVATMNNEVAHRFWEASDREGFIRYCIENTKTAAGITPTGPVASRWFNLMTIVAGTEGDFWVHREKEEVWWTVSLPAPPTISLQPDPKPLPGSRNVYVCHKPCHPWSNASKKGAPLVWPELHPRARDFLFTEGTLQQLSRDNAGYALALIRGGDLSPWHDRPAWKAKVGQTGRAPVTHLDAKRKAVVRMAMMIKETVRNAQGQTVERNTKIKELRLDHHELERYLDALLEAQEGMCAISDLKVQLDGEHDDSEMLCSVDRIDSDGHYERGNLQIVCRFINRWKGADKDAEFRRLLSVVKGEQAAV